MLSEDTNEKSVNLAFRVGKVTTAQMLKILKALINRAKKGKQNQGGKPQRVKIDEFKHGRQTLKQLTKQNEGLSSIELKQPDLRLLGKFMKKHGVDFAAAKDGKGKYTLFFKAKDVDCVTHAFKQYVKTVLKQSKGKPSMKATLDNAKKVAKSFEMGKKKEKNRNMGGFER